jgi:hypothetical protein
LKGTPKTEQNALMDSFLTITSTKSELDTTSFLSSLDMDPSNSAAAGVSSPMGSRISLPSLVAQVQASGGDGIFSAMGPSPLTPSLTDSPKNEQGADKKREVFGDFRRFVSFAVRREKGES